MSQKDKIEIPDQVGNENRGEIVLYQPEGEVRLEVRVENETVWLTQAQMAVLFERERSVIAKHIGNVFKEQELDEKSNVQILHNTLSKFKPTTIYSLDVIISVGYRVKSLRGTQFRRWANQVLKDYILKGYAINQRKIATDLQIVDRLHEQRQLIEGQGVEIAELRNTTEKRLGEQDSRCTNSNRGHSCDRNAIIDPYATIEVLKFAAMRAKGVSVTIYSPRITPEFRYAADLHKKQYPGLELKTMRTIHDRFLLVDDTVYHFGASFKDMGNEMTAYSVLDFVTPEEVIEKVEQNTKGK